MFNSSRLLALIALLLALMAHPAAQAAEYCVGSVAELDTALTAAALPTGQTTIIKFRQGNYAVAGSLLLQSRTYRAMHWLGGYNADCSARVVNPANTTIDGGGESFRGLNMQDSLLIEGLRFRNMSGSFYVGGAPTGIDFLMWTLRHNEFLGIGVHVFSRHVGNASLVFINNRVSGAPHYGLWLRYDWSDDHSATLMNNTIVGNAEYGVFAETDGYLWLDNNIVWGNPQRDIWIERDNSHTPGEAVFRRSLYATRLGTEAEGSFGTSHADPLFVDAGAANHRLQAASPAVNTGIELFNLPGTDLDGNLRVVGSRVDRGAYESAVDDTVPTSLMVTNTNDAGSGSLRHAMTQANANPDFTYIDFNMPGGCPRTIALNSPLPAIAYGVRINGWTQPGSASNTHANGDNATRCVIIDGGGMSAAGIDYAGGIGAQFWMQGVAVGGFNGLGLRIRNGNNAIVWGNQFGGRVGAVNLNPNLVNILLTQASTGASIGGDSPAQRNVIAAAPGIGISISAAGGSASTGNAIVGNLIGSWGIGTAMAGNQTGIVVATSGNSVRGNTIVHSASDGVLLTGAAATGNAIEDNRIGRAWPLCFPLPIGCTSESAANLRHGVRIESGAHANLVRANTIWRNRNEGISVAGNGKGNRLSANSIYANDGWGLDLDGSGLNDNDADPNAQNLPNRGLNYPDIARAVGGTRRGRVEGTLASINGSYQVEVFSSALPDNTPNGEGELFHRAGIALISNAPAGQNGNTSFRIAISSPAVSLAGRVIALTAIDSAGNTSEFSARVDYLCDVIFRNGLDDAEGEQCPLP